jgi:hypothetical protein
VRPGDQILTAFFAARGEVPDVIGRLLGSGVEADCIRVLPKSVHHLDDLGVRWDNKAPEGAALGAVVGGLTGALVGGLAASGAVVVPGLGSVLAGPLVAALAGAGAAGGLGVLVGALIGARLPEYEADYLEDAVRTGGALVAVRCSAERVSCIEEILAVSGARAVRRA